MHMYIYTYENYTTKRILQVKDLSTYFVHFLFISLTVIICYSKYS